MREIPRSMKFLLLLGVLLGMSFPHPLQAQVKPEVDSGLKAYQTKGQSLSGKIDAGSSETLKQMMNLWTKGFHQHHRGVAIETTLIKNTEASEAIIPDVQPILAGAKLVALSHPINESQLHEIKNKMGVQPIQIPVAMDAIVLVVHHKNPLPGLTLAQVKKIFSVSSGLSDTVERWQQFGLNSELGTRAINRYGRDTTSGTFAAFKEMGLDGAEQHKDVFAQPGSMSVVLEVGSDQAGVGYAAIGFAGRSKKVRIVPLANKEGEPFIMPNNETVASGQYPLDRQLYLYAMPDSDGTLNPAVREFVHYVLSRDGQSSVKEEGFFPLPASMTEQALGNIEGNGKATHTLSGAVQ